MIKKNREKYEKTKNVKNNDKTKNYILRGERNQKYYVKSYLKILIKLILYLISEFYNYII